MSDRNQRIQGVNTDRREAVLCPMTTGQKIRMIGPCSPDFQALRGYEIDADRQERKFL
jgi:hypothetical protein